MLQLAHSLNYEPGVWFACSCVPLVEDIGVAPPSSSSHPFPPSLHRSLGCVYGSASPLSLPCVCGARRCCCRRRLLPLPPICICCRALANTHLCSVLFFPLSFCFCPPQLSLSSSFFPSSLLLLIRKSEHTYSRGVYGERWGTDYSSLWSIEDGDEPEESAGWDRSRETHIIHRGLSKPPLPFLLSPLTLCLSLVCSLQEQPPHHFFRAAVPPSSLSLSSPSSFLPVSLSAACTTVGMQRR